MGEGKGEGKRQISGGGARILVGVVKAVKAKTWVSCSIYAREEGSGLTISEKNETTSEKNETTSEKDKTTSEENVARSLGGEEGGHFLSSGVRVLPFDAVPDFRPKVLNPC